MLQNKLRLAGAISASPSRQALKQALKHALHQSQTAIKHHYLSCFPQHGTARALPSSLNLSRSQSLIPRIGFRTPLPVVRGRLTLHGIPRITYKPAWSPSLHFSFFLPLNFQAKTHFSTSTCIMSEKKNVTVSLDPSTLSGWSKDLSSDLATSLASTVVTNHGASTSLTNRDVQKKHINVYSDSVTPEGSPVMNQKSSGRCWLFAGTNQMRIPIIRNLNLSELELSPSYLFFYDKLEKSNFFLEQIESTTDLDIESRLVQHLLTDPIGDGGQYDMFKNIILKYGLVPNSVFPDSFNTTASANMNYVILTLLRQYAQEIRDTIKSGKAKAGSPEIKALRTKQIQHVHKLLSTFLGTPPGPNDKFTWEYLDKDKKYAYLETTPLGFYKDVVQYDVSTTVSLLNDPRNPYNTLIQVDRLGNVAGEPYVTYVNTDIDVLAKTAIKLIKNNTPVFFGTHTPLYHDKKRGIIDTQLWDYKLIGFDPIQNKADRLHYHQSLMTHAMLFTAVHLDPKTGEPVRWRVENSWGSDSGVKGYYSMSHEFFKEYVYQIVAQKEDIEEPALKKLIEEWDVSKAVVLPPWDPCGALARL